MHRTTLAFELPSLDSGPDRDPFALFDVAALGPILGPRLRWLLAETIDLFLCRRGLLLVEIPGDRGGLLEIGSVGVDRGMFLATALEGYRRLARRSLESRAIVVGSTRLGGHETIAVPVGGALAAGVRPCRLTPAGALILGADLPRPAVSDESWRLLESLRHQLAILVMQALRQYPTFPV